MPSLVRQIVSIGLAFLIASSTAQAEAATAQNPGELAGVLTRWQMSSKTACMQTYQNDANLSDCPRSLMFTITPYLAGLTLRNWVSTLASAGVNTGVIFVVPGAMLPAAATISDAEWQAYNQYIYLPPAALTDAQKRVILRIGIAISKRQYTPAQRNFAIVSFLGQLHKAYPTTMPIRFMLDERLWFIGHLDANGNPLTLPLTAVFKREQDVSDDIAGIIQLAASQHLDGWLTGVGLNEYAAKDWNLMGPVMVDLATLINRKTAGWMTTHMFIGAGGGWGQTWNGINAMRCPATDGWQFPSCAGAFPFFNLMSRQVAYFAFGDKFMEFGKPQQYLMKGRQTGVTYRYITGYAAVFCKLNTRGYKCQNPRTPTVRDWQAFLEDDIDGEGFSDLIAFLSANADAYPRLANVIFEGDNSDSMATMTIAKHAASVIAITDLFRDANGGRYRDVETGTTASGLHIGTWTGKIFLNGFDDPSTVPRTSFFADTGLSMFQTNYDGFAFAPENPSVDLQKSTTAAWMRWPF